MEIAEAKKFAWTEDSQAAWITVTADGCYVILHAEQHLLCAILERKTS